MAGVADIDGPGGECVAGWQRLLAGADALVWELDAGGRLARVNAALARAVGAQDDAVRGRPFVEVVHPEDRDEVAAVIASLPARPGELVALRGRLVGHGGATTWFAGQAMFDAQLGRSVALAHDVTARVQAEEAAARERAGAAQAIADAEARLVDISDHTPAAVYVKDLEGRYLFVNRGFEATFGRRRAEVVGRTDREVLPAAMVEAFAAGEQQVRELGVAVETEEQLSSPGEPAADVLVGPLPAAAGRRRVRRDVRDRGRHDAAQAGRDGAGRARRVARAPHRRADRGGRGRVAREERVPGPDEPRAADPPQRDSRLQ
jgi:PAS domain S-box-containing protein